MKRQDVKCILVLRETDVLQKKQGELLPGLSGLEKLKI
jgi:hypothetical protein